MSEFIPNKKHSRSALIFCFHLKKTAAESYRLLREAYGEHAPSQDTCERWFRRFKSGDYDDSDKECGKPRKKYEDVKLQALLDEDDSQTQKQLAKQLGVSQQAVSNRLREMGMIQKTGRWVPYELNDGQMDKKLINIENPKPVVVAASGETAVVPAGTPKKGATAKSTKPRAKPTHPKTAEMINAAILSLKERGGSSLQAIEKYMAGTYKIDTEKQATFIRKYLKSAVASGALIQTKGKGAAGSFKLATTKVDATKPKAKPAAKAKAPKKEPVAKKPAASKKPSGATSVMKATATKAAAATAVSPKRKATKGPAAKPPKAKTTKAKPVAKSSVKKSKPIVIKKTKRVAAKPKKAAPKKAVAAKK